MPAPKHIVKRKIDEAYKKGTILEEL